MSLKKIIAGAALVLLAVLTPVTAKAQKNATMPDGIMGQSLCEEELIENGRIMTAAAPYTRSFVNNSFTTKGKYTGQTYYHKSAYSNKKIFNGIDVSWWQSDARTKTRSQINWKAAHQDGIDFAFVRVASRDSENGAIFRDTAADSHIRGALKNDVNVGLYIFSQARNEKEAVEEADYVLELLDEYQWDISLPIVMDREPGHNRRLKAGQLSRAKETSVEQAFIDTIVDAGYQAAIYASYSWFRDYIDGNKLKNCKIWFARYNYTTTSNTRKGIAYADVPVDYDFWQYTSTGVSLRGWPSKQLDMNFWYKDTNVKTKGLRMSAKSDGSLTLTWNEAAPDVTGYRVYRYDSVQNKYVAIKTTRDRTIVDTQPEAGNTYQYRVRCYWRIGGKNYYGKYSDPVSTSYLPEQVTGVRTEQQDSQSVTLAWNPVEGASGYRIYQYNDSSKKYAAVADISAQETFYKVDNLSSAEEYRFKVRAFVDLPTGRFWGKSSLCYTWTDVQ